MDRDRKGEREKEKKNKQMPKQPVYVSFLLRSFSVRVLKKPKMKRKIIPWM